MRPAPPERRIAAMFDAVAPQYDLLNDLLSLGFDRWWWRATAESLAAPPGAIVLDLGCGTGSLSERLRDRFRVVGLDASHEMLAWGRKRVDAVPLLVRGSAFRLPFGDAVFGGLASAFVLRNLDDLEAAFAELARVGRPVAGLAIIDITEPRGPVRRPLFDAYFGVAAPLLGTIAGRRNAYRYLVDSLAQLPPSEVVSEMLRKAGFVRVRDRSLAPGAVTLWTGVRSPDA